MQFDRDASGKLNPLPKPSIDTGMGLERTAAVLQGVISNYDTDLFTPLIKRAAELTGTSLTKELSKEAHTKSAASLRVIADHSRAATFLISDGVLPANDGRGYVLRKIIRRAITHGRLLGQTKPFLYEMVFAVRDLMQDAYPELKETADRVSKTVQARRRGSRTRWSRLELLEELAPHTCPSGCWRLRARGDFGLELRGIGTVKRRFGRRSLKLSRIPRFGRGCVQTLRHVRHAARLHAGCGARSGNRVRSGRLRSCDGGAEDRGHGLRGRARRSRRPIRRISSFRNRSSKDTGRRGRMAAKCWPSFTMGKACRNFKAGEAGEVILDHTPFYAESGGQVGDRGWFYSDDHNTVIAEVKGCYSPIQGVRAHQVVVKSNVKNPTLRKPRRVGHPQGWGSR